VEPAGHATGWLTTSLIYLAAAVIAVPLARALGLGSIIGYLAAGIVIGPWGLALVTDPQTILSVAEFGVVLMLFLVGLELEPRRLWQMRRPIFGWGSVQVGACTALMMLAGIAFGVPWPVALAASLGLALSSTAIGLAVLGERNAMPTNAGQGVLAIALLQDVAAIPILALLPLLGAQAADSQGGGWLGAAKAATVVAALWLGGRLALRPALRWIARSRTPEIFTAASLLLVVAAAALMHAAGLSMALGAFLAGVLLAESEYRRELETDLEPFKGLLLGLFFIAVGMSIDFSVVLSQPLLVAAIVLGFLAVKTLVIAAIARAMPIPAVEAPVFVILLAQGGEFGFVVFQSAQAAGVIDAATQSLLVAAVALSMLLTPLALVLADRWLAPRLARRGMQPLAELDAPQSAPVIVAGFGRYGQIVGRLLLANGIEPTVLDFDSENIEGIRRFGLKVFYGNATRLDLLRMAGAADARVLVVAIDDVQRSLALVDLAREHFPQLSIVARARNVQHYYQLHERGVRLIERETFDSALMSGRSVLEAVGFQRHQARNLALRFRRHNLEQLAEMAPHFKDESRLIAMSKIGRAQMEQFMAEERQSRGARGDASPWSQDEADTADRPSDHPG
jgi:glutathione-regulated potassium-efflux system ancillary protein KefC